LSSFKDKTKVAGAEKFSTTKGEVLQLENLQPKKMPGEFCLQQGFPMISPEKFVIIRFVDPP